jgi:hypothetical protein
MRSFERMPPEEQHRRVAESLEFAASLKVPVEENHGSATAIATGVRLLAVALHVDK